MSIPTITPRRIWSWLGTPGSVRAITAGMVVYALLIGALVFGYARVSSCLAGYADASAVSTAARAKAASEDRAVDEADRRITEQERDAGARADDALDAVLQAMAAQDRERTEATFADLLRVRAEVAEVRATAAAARQANNEQRAANEQRRVANPIPPPPSESC
ncbi:hypothetical protein C1I95_14790 [Micromonospora craterilacus]|uniref:Uncharacterized protein n=1 Tax=Micromonospora craterilacus TaxID=1655439 RepID=A0A2W2FS27_9ACTN|nr:hypothetical protein [Micromonospora craterilacus]PZG17814.1 hypothetical protein C1I95_14790 [Micromonospora craterilacus]